MTGVWTGNRWVKRAIALAIGALAVLTLVGAGSAARGPRLTLAWQAPTPRDGAAFTVNAGSPLTITVSASSSRAGELVLLGNPQAACGGELHLVLWRSGHGNPHMDTVGSAGGRARAHVLRADT